MKQKIIIFFALVVFLQCNTKLNNSVASGTLENPDMESKLSDDLSEFKPYLETSNSAIELISKNNYRTVAEKYFLEDENKSKNVDNFAKLDDVVNEQFGKFKSYKKNQWNFSKQNYEGNDYIQSIKIVHFRKATSFVTLTFKDGDPSKILGLYFNNPPPPKKYVKIDESYTYEGIKK
ncbi:hypothetical protein ND816_18100 [Leptospira levettii]|uniref:hypothetical protein n=1 Tax=Leptospira levettii TaxID=2023178 RepID=UPI00223D2C57|nr:hypothetical protein [Leptospira levettii]MCW7509764.1 hypothetical protein [Leptospira levettii]MCW7520851.1 hypothetical protein [Leptospira levettii]